ncbi:MAG: LrgB family protein [Flavobacteriales bacterium]|nr:LrgB family protein [Flavobacteriales bacterium]
MDKFLENPVFGLFLTLAIGWLGVKIRDKSGKSWVNPMLLSVFMLVLVLLAFDIPYESYKKGGDLIHMFLGPITVVLAVPLYTNWSYLKKYSKAIISGILLGSLSAILSVVLLSKLFGLDEFLTKSIMGRSVTTPIALAVADMLKGNQSIAIIAVSITGVFSVLIVPFVYKVLNITHPIAKGVALGTAAHAIGTGKAMEYGKVEGAMSALSIGIAGVFTILWILLFQIIGII